MILYMNRRDVPNLDRGELPSAVIDYVIGRANEYERRCRTCLLYTSDAADE